MQDDTKIQADLQRAEHDLEHKLAELKAVVEDKLATPKHIIEVIEAPIAWTREHTRLVVGVLVGATALVGIGIVWRLARGDRAAIRVG